MGYLNRQLAAGPLVVGARVAAGRQSFGDGLSFGGARLFVAELSYGGYGGAAAFARRDVGQPDRLQQSFSSARDAGDKRAGEVANPRELGVVFDALNAAARPA